MGFHRLRIVIFIALMAGMLSFTTAAYCCQEGICGLQWGGASTPVPPPPPPPPPPAPTATPVVGADPPCTPTHCYAISRLQGATPPFDGAFARFDFEHYTAPDYQNFGFSAQTVWMRDSTGDWCEVGWTHGWEGSTLDSVYYAYRYNGTYREYLDSDYPLGVYGTLHAFQIQRDAGTSAAEVYVDVRIVGACPVHVPSNGLDVGLEYTDQTAVNQGVSPYDLQVRTYATYDTVGSWTRRWDEQGAFADCRVVGPGSYLHWITQHEQYTDSSNVVVPSGCH